MKQSNWLSSDINLADLNECVWSTPFSRFHAASISFLSINLIRKKYLWIILMFFESYANIAAIFCDCFFKLKFAWDNSRCMSKGKSFFLSLHKTFKTGKFITATSTSRVHCRVFLFFYWSVHRFSSKRQPMSAVNDWIFIMPS